MTRPKALILKNVHHCPKEEYLALAQEEDAIGEYGFFRPWWEESR
jgi:hypothetical protein